MKEVIVVSLGGSLIFKNGRINTSFLKKFKTTILKNTKKYKFVVVTGGGIIAREYIHGLREINADEKLQSLAGISMTRTNARFMTYFFDLDAEEGIPHTIETLENYLKKRNVVFCGALEYKPEQTSDSTASEIARHFKTYFINITNISGLYSKNPKEHKDAKFISKISWKDFHKMANEIKYKPGQHFVLDQKASETIMKHKIKTYIINGNTKQIENIIKGKKFKGTLIFG